MARCRLPTLKVCSTLHVAWLIAVVAVPHVLGVVWVGLSYMMTSQNVMDKLVAVEAQNESLPRQFMLVLWGHHRTASVPPIVLPVQFSGRSPTQGFGDLPAPAAE